MKLWLIGRDLQLTIARSFSSLLQNLQNQNFWVAITNCGEVNLHFPRNLHYKSPRNTHLVVKVTLYMYMYEPAEIRDSTYVSLLNQTIARQLVQPFMTRFVFTHLHSVKLVARDKICCVLKVTNEPKAPPEIRHSSRVTCMFVAQFQVSSSKIQKFLNQCFPLI